MRTIFARLAPVLACLILANCEDYRGAGASNRALPVLPFMAEQPCLHPGDMLGAGDWRLIAGRLGDALIDCEGRRALAAESFDQLRSALGPR